MANPTHFNQLKQGAMLWNTWREANPDIAPDLSGVNLAQATLMGVNFKGADLNGANLSGGAFHQADFSGALLHDADLTGARLTGADLSGADLKRSNLQRARLQRCELFKADLSHSDLSYADLGGAKGFVANLSASKLTSTRMHGVDFNRSNFSAADLSYADCSGSDLTHVQLTDAILKGTLMHGVNLSNGNLSGVQGTRSNFSEAYLYSTDFSKSSFYGAIFSRTFQKEAKWAEADLSGADLSFSNFSLVDWTRTILNSSDLKGSLVDDAIITDIQIQNLTGQPLAPIQLRNGENGLLKIEGKEAEKFFEPPCLLELVFSEALNDYEIACLQLHIAQCHSKFEALSKVHLHSWQRLDGQTLLALKSTSESELYEALMDLLSPFSSLHTFQWNKVFTKPEQNNWVQSLTSAQQRLAEATTPFAKQLTDFFPSFTKAEISELKLREQTFYNKTDKEIITTETKGTPFAKDDPLAALAKDTEKIETEKLPLIIQRQPGTPLTYELTSVAIEKTKEPKTIDPEEVARLQEQLKIEGDKLKDMIEKLCQADLQDNGQKMRDDFETFSKEINRNPPRREWYELSARALIEGAARFGEMGRPAAEAISGVIELISEMDALGYGLGVANFSTIDPTKLSIDKG